ncbi:MAG: endo-alpha-N-acetylgalactosaminidase family protein, partial [Bifidobacteriaceae bacterium]|nr:endo-alpha-N-acetylgalactosaminidase family protein [Bifidobacteriaceae bacterium]
SIDHHYDLASGQALDRLRQLRDQAPGLAGVHIAGYDSSGWVADALAKALRAPEWDLELASERPDSFDGASIWSLQAASQSAAGGGANPSGRAGGAAGLGSEMLRFIANADRDVWNPDPLLGGAELVGFEGWSGQNNWDEFYRNIWAANLPTKFLQHYDLVEWEAGQSARLSDGDHTVTSAMEGGQRVIRMDQVTVARGGDYLLPWGEPAAPGGVSSPSRPSKMYLYSTDGASLTWELTEPFAGTRVFDLFRLTDQGRVKAATVTASGAGGGAVTLQAEAGVAYVLAPAGGAQPLAQGPHIGENGLVDPGFNAGDLAAWNPKGEARLDRAPGGDNVVVFGPQSSSIAQVVAGLTPGRRYTFSVDVEIEKDRRRPVSLTAGEEGRTFDTSPLANLLAADVRAGTNAQRGIVPFTAPDSGAILLKVSAGPGAAAVLVDNARVIADETHAPPKGPRSSAELVFTDFETNQPGWGPFIHGDAGGLTDPGTHVSKLNQPYTQAAWKDGRAPFNSGPLKGLALDDVIGGVHSLKSHDEPAGLVYRTQPSTLALPSGHLVRVEFDYQANLPGRYAWVRGADKWHHAGKEHDAVLAAVDLAVQPLAATVGPVKTAHHLVDYVTGCDDEWVGLRRLTDSGEGADLVLDNFKVTDLGAAATAPTCPEVQVLGGADLHPGQNRLTTKFSNPGTAPATNVVLGLNGLPADWTVQTVLPGGNHFDSVAGGSSVKTAWLVTVPESAAGTAVDFETEGVYFAKCAIRRVSAPAAVSVGQIGLIPSGALAVTADEQQAALGEEGPAANAVDGDAETIWQTKSDGGEADNHWIQFDLGVAGQVNALEYQPRPSGEGGWIKDFRVLASTDAAEWTQVAAGVFATRDR